MAGSYRQNRVLARTAGTSALHSLARWLHRAWQRARQRRELFELDDRLLRDIGISRGEARRQSTRPFWR